MRGKWSQFPVSEPEKHRKTKSSGTSPPVWHNQSWESHEGDLISLRMFLSPSSLISPHGVLQLIKSRPREIFKPHSNTSAIRDDYRKRKIMTLGLLHIEISSWWFCFSSRSSIRTQEVKTRWIHEKTTCWKWDGNVFSALQRSDVFWFLRFLVSDASRTLWFLVIPKKSTQQLIQTVLTGSDKVFQSVSLHFVSTIGAQTVASQPRMKTILRFFPHIFQISWISTQLLNASDENAPIKTENVMEFVCENDSEVIQDLQSQSARRPLVPSVSTGNFSNQRRFLQFWHQSIHKFLRDLPICRVKPRWASTVPAVPLAAASSSYFHSPFIFIWQHTSLTTS